MELCTRLHRTDQALAVYAQMRAAPAGSAMAPTAHAYTAAMKAACEGGLWARALEIWGEMEAAGCPPSGELMVVREGGLASLSLSKHACVRYRRCLTHLPYLTPPHAPGLLALSAWLCPDTQSPAGSPPYPPLAAPSPPLTGPQHTLTRSSSFLPAADRVPPLRPPPPAQRTRSPLPCAPAPPAATGPAHCPCSAT